MLHTFSHFTLLRMYIIVVTSHFLSYPRSHDQVPVCPLVPHWSHWVSDTLQCSQLAGPWSLMSKLLLITNYTMQWILGTRSQARLALSYQTTSECYEENFHKILSNSTSKWRSNRSIWIWCYPKFKIPLPNYPPPPKTFF